MVYIMAPDAHFTIQLIFEETIIAQICGQLNIEICQMLTFFLILSPPDFSSKLMNYSIHELSLSIQAW